MLLQTACEKISPSLVGWILCHTVFCPVLFVLYLSRVTISPYFRDTQKDKTTTYSLFKGASTSTVHTVSEEYAMGMHGAVNTYMFIPVPISIYPYQEGAGKHVHSSLSVLLA